VRNLEDAKSVLAQAPKCGAGNDSSYLVGGEDDVRSSQETSTEHVAEGVILLVESEDGGRGKAWNSVSVRLLTLLNEHDKLTSVNLDIDLVLARAEQDSLISVFKVRHIRCMKHKTRGLILTTATKNEEKTEKERK
jgi:hypothetical protein